MLLNRFFFLSGRLKWSSIYPQQPVTVGSSPDLFVICSFTTSSAHVGWIPTVADNVLYVRPHLEKTHTCNLWETQFKCSSTTFVNDVFEDIAYGSHIFFLRVPQRWHHLIAAANPWMTSPAEGPRKCNPKINRSPSLKQTTWTNEKEETYFPRSLFRCVLIRFRRAWLTGLLDTIVIRRLTKTSATEMETSALQSVTAAKLNHEPEDRLYETSIPLSTIIVSTLAL